MPQTAAHTPSAAATVFHGAWRFTATSLAAFSVWAFGGQLLKPLGHLGLDLVCAVVFVALGGFLLHPLTKGRLTIGQFYSAFGLAFAGYVVVWIAAWYGIKGRTGEYAYTLFGPIVLAALLLRQTKTHPASVPLLLGAVALHTLGYFAGDSLYNWSKSPACLELLPSLSRGERFKLGAMLWGFAFGLGLGSAIGLVLHQIATQPPREALPPASPLSN